MADGSNQAESPSGTKGRKGSLMTDPDTTDSARRPRTMSVTEAAEVLGISRTTAYECVHTGALPALRLGGRIVVPTQALEDLLASALIPQS